MKKIKIKTNKFIMAQAKMRHGVKYNSIYIAEKGNGEDASKDMISELLGDTINIGGLFAYLFRRFGYPERGCDGYKDLAYYLLTTPKEDLFLGIRLNSSDSSHYSIHFFVPADVAEAGRVFPYREYYAWCRKACDHYEKSHPLPDWIGGWLKQWREFVGASKNASWKDSLHSMNLFADASDEEGKMIRDFYQAVIGEYAEIEVEPDIKPGWIADWRKRENDDPLKPYAEAGYGALKDLLRPVKLRDTYLFLDGKCECDSKGFEPVDCSSSAGYAPGGFINPCPKEFCELHEKVAKLGRGDVKKGVKRALKKLGKR